LDAADSTLLFFLEAVVPDTLLPDPVVEVLDEMKKLPPDSSLKPTAMGLV
jgi:hypothetical protein